MTKPVRTLVVLDPVVPRDEVVSALPTDGVYGGSCPASTACRIVRTYDCQKVRCATSSLIAQPPWSAGRASSRGGTASSVAVSAA